MHSNIECNQTSKPKSRYRTIVTKITPLLYLHRAQWSRPVLQICIEIFPKALFLQCVGRNIRKAKLIFLSPIYWCSSSNLNYTGKKKKRHISASYHHWSNQNTFLSHGQSRIMLKRAFINKQWSRIEWKRTKTLETYGVWDEASGSRANRETAMAGRSRVWREGGSKMRRRRRSWS